MKALLKAVWKDGDIQLYDIYIGDKWIGSRRSIFGCGLTLNHYKVESYEVTGLSPPQGEQQDAPPVVRGS